MAIVGPSASEMGRRVEAEDPESVCFLHGWRGDEDDDVDVDIESSDGNSEGELAGLKWLSESASTGACGLGSIRGRENSLATLNKGLDFPENSMEEASEVGGQECVSGTGGSTGLPTKEVCEVTTIEQTGLVAPPEVGASQKEPKEQKRPSEGKRLDARKFRNIFAAKLGGSKRLKNGLSTTQGKAQGDVELCKAGQALSSSSLEKSGQMPSICERLKRENLTADRDEQEEENGLLLTDVKVSEHASSDSLLSAGSHLVNEKETCKVFSRKRKVANQSVVQAGDDSDQTTTLHLLEGNDAETMHKRDCLQSEVRVRENVSGPDKASDSVRRVEDGVLGRSKRARKDNTQKDYIPWAAFRRSSVKKIDRNKVDGLKSSIHCTETDADLRVSAVNIEKDDKLVNSSSASGEEETATRVDSHIVQSSEAQDKLMSQSESMAVCVEKNAGEKEGKGDGGETYIRADSGNKSRKPDLEHCTAGSQQQVHNLGTSDNCPSQGKEAEVTLSEGSNGSQEFEFFKCRKHRSVEGCYCGEADVDPGDVHCHAVQGKQSNDMCGQSTSFERRNTHECDDIQAHSRDMDDGDNGNKAVNEVCSSLLDQAYLNTSLKVSAESEKSSVEGVGYEPEPPDFHGMEGTIVQEQLITRRKLDVDCNVMSAIEGPGRDVDISIHLFEDAENLEDISGMDDHDSICKGCKQAGDLICCDGKGCKITYHIACLEPPLIDVPPGTWYCPDCVCKRISSGVHSVSKGLESIWNVKESMVHGSEPKAHNASSIVADDKERRLNGKDLHQDLHDRGSFDVSREKSQVRKEQDVSVAVVEAKDHQGIAGVMGAQALATVVQPQSVLNMTGAQRFYFVKYKGVAHAHNLWLPEVHVLKEAPKLLSSFKKKLEQGKASRWDPAWVKPFRVIGKRFTMISKKAHLICGGENGYESGQCLEWFVKWKNLGYESCTWELGDKGPLDSEDGKELIKRYEMRLEKAGLRANFGSEDNVENLRAGTFMRLSAQPVWIIGGQLQCHVLDAINKLRQFWHSGTNGIVMDEVHEERITKTVAFLVSLVEEFHVLKPILVVVSPPAFTKWEAALNKWASNVNVVVYSGTKEAREIIHRCELYNRDGHVMAEIVLTTFDTLNMDVENFRQLKFEALVIDECARLKGSKTSKSIQQLDSVYCLLLLSEPLKNTADDYYQILSILGYTDEALGAFEQPPQEDTAMVAKLKTTLHKHIVYEHKQDVTVNAYPKEYWVPVEMTATQVEEYCKVLIDKADTLTRGKRGDRVSSPHELLLKIRECCNHPYLVNPDLQNVKDISAKELLDLGIQMSGKLRILDMMLSEARCANKRVVIITQMHLRSEKSNQMEILDDYMRQQFGVHSYERVDVGLASNKKVAAMQHFNTVNSGCFVFLLDKRACGQAIKLLSVNCIIIFDSDWNPQSDIQALLKVRFDPPVDHVTICRFYSPHSVEERALIAARRNADLDCNHRFFTLALCQKLLRWGVRKNFHFFDVISGRKDQDKGTDEMRCSGEHTKLLLGQDKSQVCSETYSNNPYWRTALYPREAGRYTQGLPLYGETDEELAEEDTVSPTDFWLDILKDRQIESQGAQGRELRARKKVQYCEDSLSTRSLYTQGSLEEEELQRKRRKISEFADPIPNVNGLKSGKSTLIGKERGMDSPPAGNDASAGVRGVDSNRVNQKSLGKLGECLERSPRVAKEVGFNTSKQQNSLEGGFGHKSLKERQIGSESLGAEGTSEPGTGIRIEQHQLLLSMKADLDRLCQALQFQADTAAHVEQLLFSIGSSFKLPKERSYQHAVELSLCWLAAEQQHYSIDRRTTLSIAESCFGVKLERVDTVYAKLEERWKKRFSSIDQPVQQQLMEHDTTKRGEAKFMANVEAEEEVPSQREAQGLVQDPATLSIQEHQRLPDVSETGTISHCVEERLAIERRKHTSGAVRSQEPHQVGEVQRAECHPLSPKSQSLMKEKLTNERRERMQTLLQMQKMQIRNLDVIEKERREKIKQLYEKECTRISSKNGIQNKGESLAHQQELYLKRLRIAEISFKSSRDNLVKKQDEEREKENKLMVAQMQMISGGEIPKPLPSLHSGTNGISGTHVFNIPPACLEPALEAAVCPSPSLHRGTQLVPTTKAVTAVSAEGDRLEAVGNQSPQIVNNVSQNPAMGSGVTGSEQTLQGLATHDRPGGSTGVSGRIIDNGTALMQEGASHTGDVDQQESTGIHNYVEGRQQEQRQSQHQQQPRHSSASTMQVRAQQVATSGGFPTMMGIGVNQQPQPPSPSPIPALPHPPPPLPPQSQPHPHPQPQLHRQHVQVRQAQPNLLSHPQYAVQAQIQAQAQPSQQYSQAQQHSQAQGHQTSSLQPQHLLQQSQVQQTQANVATNDEQQVQTAWCNRNELGQATTAGPVASGSTYSPTPSRGSNRVMNQVGGGVTSLSQAASSAGVASLCAPALRGGTGSGSPGPSVTRILPNVPSHLSQQYHNDPLAKEFLRLRKEQDKIKSAHEAEKERLKNQFSKEQEALKKKYEAILQEEDYTYSQKVVMLEFNMKKVEMNRRLAEAFRLKNSLDSSPSVGTETTGTGSFQLNTETTGTGFNTDARLFAGASQTQSCQQQGALATSTRMPSSSLQCMLALPSLSEQGRGISPSVSTVFERPAVPDSSPSTSAGVFVQLPGPHGVSGSSHSHLQITSGLWLPSVYASTAAVSSLCQSRPMLQTSNQSPHFPESNHLLSSRSAMQISGQVTQARNRSPSVASVPSNSFARNSTSLQHAGPASCVQNSQSMNPLSAGTCPLTAPTHFLGRSSGRTSTHFVTTYSTAVASHLSTSTCPSTGEAVVAPVISSRPQIIQGVAQENLSFLGLPMALPSSYTGMDERPFSDSLTCEISRPLATNTFDPQNREVGCTGLDSQAACSHSMEGINKGTPRLLSNGLQPTNMFDDSGNIVASAVICLSDDD